MDVSRGVPRAANHHGMRRDAVSTAQLQRLRAMARGSDSGAGTHTGRCVVERGDAPLRGAVLTWRGHSLAWWQGAALVRVFSYGEGVRAACAARMEGAGTRDAETALVVLLERTVMVYFPRLGEEHALPLSFAAQALSPVAVGIMLHGEASAYYVRSVFDTPAEWTCVDAVTHAPDAILHGALQRFPRVDERVVYVDDAVVVTASAAARAVRLYEYVCAAAPLVHMAPRTRAAPDAARPRKSRRSSAWHAHGRRRSSRRLSEQPLRVSDFGESLVSMLDAVDCRAPSVARTHVRQRASLAAAPEVDEVDPLFAQFARAHASAALLETLSVPELATPADTAQVRCFVMDGRLYVFVPASRRVFGREVRRRGERVTAAPPADADAVFVARDVCAVSVLDGADALAVVGDDGVLRLVCGAPGPGVCSVCLCDGAVGRLVPTADGLDVDGAVVPVYARPADADAAWVLDALWRALPRADASRVVARWIAWTGDAWTGLAAALGVPGARVTDAAALADALGVGALGETAPGAAAAAPGASVPVPSRAAVALCLHLLAQDALVDMHRRRTAAPRVVALLLGVCRQLGWSTWVDMYERECPAAEQRATEQAATRPCPAAPPTLYALLAGALRGAPTTLSAESARLAAALGVPPPRSLRAVRHSAALLDVYAALGDGAPTRVVAALLDAGWDAAALARLPPGVALPLDEALRACQQDPPADWAPAAYALLRRLDARAQVHGAAHARVPARLARTLPPGLDALSGVVFRHDYRLAEVAEMLATTRAHAAVTAGAPDDDESARNAAALVAARAVAERTMAQCIGRGMFQFVSRALRSTGTWRTPRLCLAARVDHTLVPAEPRDDALEWPEFHNGVASALELGGAQIDSSWIFAHASATPGGRARHAGFLLGLGLQGHLTALGRVHAYRYLAPRHTLTTVGLVLGLAASFAGTGDAAARQVMAVQVAAFLPPGSVPLQFATLTQAAGLLGMGLVFCGTDHRWTAARLATQLDAPLDTADANAAHHDVYAQCAGLGLGLVCLGRGRRTPMDAASDAALVARLRRLAAAADAGAAGSDPVGAARAAGPAALALALVFLRSGRHDVAQWLDPPATLQDLEHVRPDLLFVRALARALVLGAPAPTDAWLDAAVGPLRASASPAARLAQRHLRGGACAALGLLLAGTGDADARALLLREYAAVDDGAPAPSTYAARIDAAARQGLRDVLGLALACVMAGSGDLDVLRVLRRAHGALEAPYGSHVAAHMALGLLFLGGGRFSLATHDVALAALLISVLPPFPSTPGDCRAHLQAARHLWVLAAAPCLVAARDVASGDVCLVPVAVRGARRMAPVLVSATPGPLAAPAEIITSASRRYWPAAVAVRAGGPPAVHWLHVQRRTGYLSYADDPHGHRSIFARSVRCAAPRFGADAHADPHGVRRDLEALVGGFDTAPGYRVFVRRVCGHVGGAPRFAASVLLDSLMRDAPTLTPAYLALWEGLATRDVRLVHDVYLLEAYYAARERLGQRERLVPRETLDSLRWQMRAAAADASDALRAYLGQREAGATVDAFALAALRAPLRDELVALRTRLAAAPDALLAQHVLRQVLPTAPLADALVSTL